LRVGLRSGLSVPSVLAEGVEKRGMENGLCAGKHGAYPSGYSDFALGSDRVC